MIPTPGRRAGHRVRPRIALRTRATSSPLDEGNRLAAWSGTCECPASGRAPAQSKVRSIVPVDDPSCSKVTRNAPLSTVWPVSRV